MHGNISNPTEVHEIEIVYDDGVMFFRERAIELKPIEPPRTLEKKMKRFVKICPNLTQSVISGKFEDGLNGCRDCYGILTKLNLERQKRVCGVVSLRLGSSPKIRVARLI